MRVGQGQAEGIEITVAPHGGMRARCSQCKRSAPGYDRLPERHWQFVPLWGIATWFRYAPRRVECAEHGVIVEHIPWSDGKRPMTTAMMGFLARWARRLSWRETAQVFQTSWESVYRSVEWMVEWGLAHRQLDSVKSLGVDEIHWGHGTKADNFLTVIYQIDAHCRRLLWIGKRRSEKTLRNGVAGAGTGAGQGTAFCMQRHVEALSERSCRRGRSGVTCAGSVPHHPAHELGGGRGAPRREQPLAGQEQGRGQAAEEHALAVAAQGKPGARPGPQKAERPAGQQAGDGPGMGTEGGVRPLLEIQIAPLGRGLSGLLAPAGDAQPSGTDAESRPHVTCA